MTNHTGHIPAVAAVLDDPFLNRGMAFTAAERGVATTRPGNLMQAVQDAMWQPVYEGGAV